MIHPRSNGLNSISKLRTAVAAAPLLSNRLSFRLQIACIPYVKACGGKGSSFLDGKRFGFRFSRGSFHLLWIQKKPAPRRCNPLPHSTTWNGYRRTGLFSLYHIRARFVTPRLRIAARWLHSERGEERRNFEERQRSIQTGHPPGVLSSASLVGFPTLSEELRRSQVTLVPTR